MKRLILFILLVSTLNAKGQSFSGVQAFLPDIMLHPNSYSGGKASIGKMAFDRANNKYILGWFDGIMDLDPGPNIHSDTSFGQGNLFVLKEDAAGNIVWAKQFAALSPSSYTLGGTEIDVDASGNIYIAGYIRDSVDMDPGPGVYRFSTGGASVAFILKLDTSGNFVWAKRHEADTVTNWSFINGMKVIGSSIYATADFVGTVDLDPGPGIFNVTAPPGERSMLLIKMDTAGNFIWGKTIGGDKGINYINDFATDNAANLYIAGGFQDVVDFDPGPGVYALNATPWAPGSPFGYNTDIFIAKYDSAGNISWAHSFGTPYKDEGKGVAVDRFGNVFFSGTVTSAHDSRTVVDFDPGPGVATLYTYASGFLLKLRSNGDFAWVIDAAGGDIATDNSGNVYPGPVTKIDSSGKSLWQGQWIGSILPTINVAWLGLDKNDTIYFTGAFSRGGDFDPSDSVFFLWGLPYATQSGFILKLNQNPNPWHGAGINGTSQSLDVSIQPNPSSGTVTFSSPIAIHRIELTDMSGKVVYMAEPNKTKTVIDLGGKAAGVYFYEVDCASGKQRGKLVVY